MDTPTENIWMPLNLPWKQDFWEELNSMKTMRLNPHWHITESETVRGTGDGAAYDIDDILSDRQYTIHVMTASGPDHWEARFGETGLVIRARSEENGENTALSFEIDQRDEEPVISREQVANLIEHWLPSIREYYRLFTADTWRNRFFRFLMNKVMLSMNPTQRRICAFMFKLTVLEALLIIVLGVGFYFYAN